MSAKSSSRLKSVLKQSVVWMWLVLAAVSLGVTLLAFRQNNLHMIELRDAVVKADKDNGNVEKALQELRQYVSTHMNTNTSNANGIQQSIQLKYRYDRLVQAEAERVKAANGKIYSDAQAYCEAHVPGGFSGRGRVPCITEYVSSHGIKTQPIPDALYKFDFVSPRWAPDLAGWSMVLCGIFLTLFAVSAFIEYKR